MEKEKVPLKDSIFLSPIEKYKIYGRFPWKMVFHIMLVLATTAQAILILSKVTQYTRAQERFIYNNFISDSDKTAIDYPRSAYLYSISQLLDHLNQSVSNFYDIQDISLEEIEYLNPIDQLNVCMEFSYLDNKNIKTKSVIEREFVYNINQTDFGPFMHTNDEIKTFLNSVNEFRLNYTFRTYVPFYYINHFECFHWNILQIYNFEQRAHFVVKLNINRLNCDDRTQLSMAEYFIDRLMWIHLIVIFLATMSLILTWKYVYKIAQIYWKLSKEPKESTDNRKLSTNTGKYENLNIKDRSKFFNKWTIISLLGNVVQLFGSSMSLFDTDNIMSSTELLVGFGCMLSYINIGRYLDYNREYSTIFATISRAMPNVLRYLLGVMPIFFGFLFFGLCLFWRSERFVSTSSSMITLFAMLNGDSVFDIFRDLTGVSFFLGQLYCYIFCIMFIVVVMNVFISIIEEAYVSTKMKNQNHWIYSYLKVDPKYIHIKDIEEENNKHGDENKNSFNAMKHSKEQRELLSNVKSKNIMREIFENKAKKDNSQVDKSSKQGLEKIIDTHFGNIEKNLNEVLEISKEISQSQDNHLKDELRLFIFDHISTLENRITHLREIWIQQNY